MKSFSAGLLLISLVVLSVVQEGSGRRRPGKGRPGKPGRPGRPGRPGKPGNSNKQCYTNACYLERWTTTGEVPNKLAQAPPAPLYISYNKKKVQPNDTVTTEQMLRRPSLSWKTERGALYTVLLIDFGIERLEGLQYYHWLVSNVRSGKSIRRKNEVMEYIPPFTFVVSEDGTLDTTVDGKPKHDILALVYKQKNGRVDMADERQTECDATIVDSRIGDHVALAEKYDLELVAGNFLFTTYTEGSNDLLCYFTKCSGEPFPLPAPGINDGPECQQ